MSDNRYIKPIAKWVLNETKAVLRKEHITIQEYSEMVPAVFIAGLIHAKVDGVITHATARQMHAAVVEAGLRDRQPKGEVA